MAERLSLACVNSGDQPANPHFLVQDFVVRCLVSNIIEPRHEKTNVLVSDPVRHKPGPGSTAKENG